MPFSEREGSLTNVFLTESDFIDRYTGQELFLWGNNNNFGQLGDNTFISKSSPVQTVSTGTNWKQISTGGNYITSAIKTDGTLWCWGNNSSGGIGDNTISNRSSPVQTISTGTNWKQVSCGYYITSAIKTDGTLWLWGSNTSGVLGDNTVINRSSPVQTISGGTNWKQVSAGSNNTSAIKTDGTLWNWGSGSNGLLGDNTVANKSSPVQTVSTGTNWKQVSAGGSHVAAIKTDGTLWLWGRNDYGLLGDNTVANRSSPVQTISTGTNWKQVSAGNLYTAAIKTDGSLWLWGRNLDGQLGTNDTNIARSSPVQTISTGTNWKQVSAGSHTAAIKTDGSLWLWGTGAAGQIGDNTVILRSSPVQTISTGTNWKQVSTSTYTAALRITE